MACVGGERRSVHISVDGGGFAEKTALASVVNICREAQLSVWEH